MSIYCGDEDTKTTHMGTDSWMAEETAGYSLVLKDDRSFDQVAVGGSMAFLRKTAGVAHGGNGKHQPAATRTDISELLSGDISSLLNSFQDEAANSPINIKSASANSKLINRGRAESPAFRVTRATSSRRTNTSN